MIRTRILEDFFLVWSIPRDTAARLAPPPLRPLIFDERGWLTLAAVHLEKIRCFGVPVAARANVASLMLISEFVDAGGTPRIGNYFLRGFTDNRPLVWGCRLFGCRVFERADVQIAGSRILIPSQFEARMDMGVPLGRVEQDRFDRLFHGDHGGLLSLGARVVYSHLEKSHWIMKGHPMRILRDDLLREYSARYEFAGDTSDGHGLWHFPHRVAQTRRTS